MSNVATATPATPAAARFVPSTIGQRAVGLLAAVAITGALLQATLGIAAHEGDAAVQAAASAATVVAAVQS